MTRQEQWQLSGEAPQVYERYLVPAALAPLAAGLIEEASLRPGDCVLDVACGTGIVARLAAQRVAPGGKVMGLDLNPGMLAIARSNRPHPGALTGWLRGDAVALPFPARAFDVVLCQQGLQYFPDKALALREMYRVLMSGGRLALSVVGPIRRSPGHFFLAEALERHVSSEVARILRAGFSLGDAEVLRGLVAGAEFCGVVIRPAVVNARFPSPEEFVRHQVAGSPLAGPLAGVDEEARAAVIRDVKAALKPYTSEDGVAFPIETHHAVARR